MERNNHSCHKKLVFMSSHEMSQLELVHRTYCLVLSPFLETHDCTLLGIHAKSLLLQAWETALASFTSSALYSVKVVQPLPHYSQDSTHACGMCEARQTLLLWLGPSAPIVL